VLTAGMRRPQSSGCPYTLAMGLSAPSVHDQIASGLREHPAKKGLPFNIFVTILEIGGSITLFHLARRMGASDVVSYLVGSIAPVLGGLAIWVKARKFSGASAAIFTFTFISAVIALAGSTTPKMLLYKDCAATALVGLVFLGSCVLARKPLVFYFAQRTARTAPMTGCQPSTPCETPTPTFAEACTSLANCGRHCSWSKPLEQR
jgi:hypothetical protein